MFDGSFTLIYNVKPLKFIIKHYKNYLVEIQLSLIDNFERYYYNTCGFGNIMCFGNIKQQFISIMVYIWHGRK